MSTLTNKIYANEEPAGISRRFFAFVLDILIFVVAYGVIFFGTSQIISSTPYYKECNTILNQEILNMYHLHDESKIYSYSGEGDEKYEHPIELEVIVKTWILNNVKLSYSLDKSVFESNKITPELDDYTPSSYDNDNLSYFYVNFAVKYNNEYHIVDFQNKQPKEYYVDLFRKNAFNYNENSLWNYPDNFGLPILTPTAAFDVYYYLKISNSNQVGLSTYNLIASTYKNIWEEEVVILRENPIYKVHNDAYLLQYRNCSLLIDLGILISFAISYFLVFILPQLLFKSHLTLGKKFIHIQPVDVEGYPMMRWQYFVRNAVKFFAIFGFTILPNYFFFSSSGAWMYPLFSIGNFGVSIFALNVIILLVDVISFFIGVIIRKKRDLSDLIAHTYLIDMRYHMELEESRKIVVDQNQKESEIENPEIEVDHVVDRTTINK